MKDWNFPVLKEIMHSCCCCCSLFKWFKTTGNMKKENNIALHFALLAGAQQQSRCQEPSSALCEENVLASC